MKFEKVGEPEPSGLKFEHILPGDYFIYSDNDYTVYQKIMPKEGVDFNAINCTNGYLVRVGILPESKFRRINGVMKYYVI